MADKKQPKDFSGNLFLRINKPEGKTVALMNKRTVVIVPKSETLLFPDKPTKAADLFARINKDILDQMNINDAKELGCAYINQDPHLVTDVKYSEKNDPNIAQVKARNKELAAKDTIGRPLTAEELASKQRFGFDAKANRSNNPRQEAIEQNVADAAEAGPVDDTDYAEKYAKPLTELMTVELGKATKKVLKKFANQLDCEYNSKTTNEEFVEIINARADVITKKMEEQLASGDLNTDEIPDPGEDETPAPTNDAQKPDMHDVADPADSDELPEDDEAEVQEQKAAEAETDDKK